MFKANRKLTDADRSKVTQMLAQESPNARKKRTIIWLEDGMIVKSSVGEVADLRERLDGADVNGGSLSSVKTSGAVGKLKRLAKSGSDEEFGQVLQ